MGAWGVSWGCFKNFEEQFSNNSSYKENNLRVSLDKNKAEEDESVEYLP